MDQAPEAWYFIQDSKYLTTCGQVAHQTNIAIIIAYYIVARIQRQVGMRVKEMEQIGLFALVTVGSKAWKGDSTLNIYVWDLVSVAEQGCDPRQVSNVDETVFYWNKLPKNTFIVEAEMNAQEYEAQNQRLILLIWGNVCEDCKLNLMRVKQSQNLRALRNTRAEDLQVTWYSNEKAWMTTFLGIGSCIILFPLLPNTSGNKTWTKQPSCCWAKPHDISATCLKQTPI